MVTIDERIDAWISNGGDKDEAELMRYKAIMFQRMPKDIVPEKVPTKNFGGKLKIFIDDLP